HLHNSTGSHAHGGDRHGPVLVVPDLGHADLFADDRLLCHLSLHANASLGRVPARHRSVVPWGPRERAPTDVSSQIRRRLPPSPSTIAKPESAAPGRSGGLRSTSPRRR